MNLMRIAGAATLLALVLAGCGRTPDREFTVGYLPLAAAPAAPTTPPPALAHSVMAQAARRAGIRIRWVASPAGPHLSLATGTVDLWPLLPQSDAKAGAVYVSKPFHREMFLLILPASSPARSLDQLAAARVGFHGSEAARLLKAPAIAVAAPDPNTAIAWACQGTTTAAVVRGVPGKDPAPGCAGAELRALTIDVPATRIGFGAAVRNAGATAAADRLAGAAAEMWEDGALNALLLTHGEAPSIEPLLESSREWKLYGLAIAILHVLSVTALGFLLLRYRRARIEAEAARQQALLASRAKNEFFATLSHELRTPMNGVLGMAEALSHSGLSAGQAESVGILRRSAEALVTLIDDLLDFARLDAGKLRIDSKPFDLWAALEEAALVSETQARRQGLELRLLFGANLPNLVVGDARRLRQVVINLVSNAVKFTPAGSVTVSARVANWNGPEARVRIAVTDTGIGIDPAKHHLLFQRFSRVDTTSGRPQTGTGLGLAIVKELVTAMGGEAGVLSERGKGATFWFELSFPCGPDTAVPTGAAPQKVRCRTAAALAQVRALLAEWNVPQANVEAWIDETAPSSLAEPVRPTVLRQELYGPPPGAGIPAPASGLRGRVLLVEDNAINERVAAALLQKLGIEVDVAHNGVECLERWTAGKYDAILMDCTMPVMDGLEATRLIRQRESPQTLRTPIIALTATVLEQARIECLQAGMDAFVAKPVRREALEPLLAQWLPRRPSA